MEVLEHRNSSDGGVGFKQSTLDVGISNQTSVGDNLSCGSQGGAGELGLDITPERPEVEGTDERHAGPLEVFHQGASPGEPASSIVMDEALRCQVKITTRRSLHLRIANHTARNVYVRLVGNGEHIAEINAGLPRNMLEQSVAVKDSVPLSPLKPPATPADTDQQGTDGGSSAVGKDPHQPPCVSMESSNPRPQTPKAEDEVKVDDEASGPLTISEHVYSPCASMLPTPVDESQGGVDLLFSSPVQSPARLLRELHADPDIQAQLEAEREQDRAYECTRLAARGPTGGALSSSLRLLSSSDRVTTCVLSVARFVAGVTAVLLVTVPTLLLLLESDIDVSFLHEIRQTPEFEQFHYEYYCPLRRWMLCRISMVMENLWSD